MKKPNFSPEQRAYVVARASHTALMVERARRFAAAGLGVTRSMSDEAAEAVFLAQEKIESELGCYRSRRALRAAEEAMVAWGVTYACAHSPAHTELLRSAQDRAKRSAIYWPKLVDICFKLAA